MILVIALSYIDDVPLDILLKLSELFISSFARQNLSQRVTYIAGDCDMLNKPTCKQYYIHLQLIRNIYICEMIEATELWEKDHKFNILGWENWKAI